MNGRDQLDGQDYAVAPKPVRPLHKRGRQEERTPMTTPPTRRTRARHDQEESPPLECTQTSHALPKINRLQMIEHG